MAKQVPLSQAKACPYGYRYDIGCASYVISKDYGK